MQRFILMENIARFRTWLAEEHDEFDRRVVRELLAKALRDFAIFQAESAGLIAEIDVSQSQEQKTMFRNSFETSGDPYLLLDPRKGLHIVDINGAYGEATMTSSAKVAGNRLFDIFPDNPQDPKADGVSNLFTSLSRVVETGKLDTMAIQRYDVRDADGVFVTKYWKPVNRPIVADGRLIYLLHHVEDVTEAVAKKQLSSCQS